MLIGKQELDGADYALEKALEKKIINKKTYKEIRKFVITEMEEEAEKLADKQFEECEV